jgi:hypothetical protein
MTQLLFWFTGGLIVPPTGIFLQGSYPSSQSGVISGLLALTIPSLNRPNSIALSTRSLNDASSNIAFTTSVFDRWVATKFGSGSRKFLFLTLLEISAEFFDAVALFRVNSLWQDRFYPPPNGL